MSELQACTSVYLGKRTLNGYGYDKLAEILRDENASITQFINQILNEGEVHENEKTNGQ